MQDSSALLNSACRAFVRQAFRRHLAPTLVPSICVLLVVLAYLIHTDAQIGAWMVGVTILVSVGFWTYVLTIRPAKLASRLLPVFLSTRIVPTTAGIEVDTDSKHVLVPWEAIIWRQMHPDFHLLALSPMAFLVVPTEGLSSQAKQLLEAQI